MNDDVERTQRVLPAVDSSRVLSFQKLRVYQRAITFLSLAVDILERFPKGHADLADQLLRAAQSIPRNIAEGAGRRTPVDQARFYVMARGSAMECAAALDTMKTMKLIGDDRYDVGTDHLEAVVAMLTRMC